MKHWMRFLVLVCVMVLCSGMAAAQDYGYAVVDGGSSDRIHLRARPSVQETSMGLYFTGTEVQCISNPLDEWVQVVVGTHVGYMMSRYLVTGSRRSSVIPRQPLGVVSTARQQGAALRYEPVQDSSAYLTLGEGEKVTVLGETHNHWYYVQADGQLGYVSAAELTVGQVPASVSSWQKAYRQCLNTWENVESYMLYDIDGDRVPELLLRTGTCEADTMLEVYAMQNGAAVQLGRTGFSHAQVCGMPGAMAFLIVHGQMGNETVEECNVEFGGLTVTELYTMELQEYTPYQALTEYMPGDPSGLNWQGDAPTDNLLLLNGMIQPQG